MDKCFSRTKANTETFFCTGSSEKDPIWQICKAKSELSQSLQNQTPELYQNNQSSFWKGHFLFIAVKTPEKKRKRKRVPNLTICRTKRFKPKAKAKYEHNAKQLSSVSSIHKIIQGINFTPTFISKTCKISYVMTA